MGVAEERDLGAYIVLPFEPERFRRTSVIDRPGDWGARYDQAIARARKEGRLEIIATDDDRSDDEAYAVVSDRMLERALELGGSPAGVVAIALWEGRPRSDNDLTWRLLREAERTGVAIVSVSTLPLHEQDA